MQSVGLRFKTDIVNKKFEIRSVRLEDRIGLISDFILLLFI